MTTFGRHNWQIGVLHPADARCQAEGVEVADCPGMRDSAAAGSGTDWSGRLRLVLLRWPVLRGRELLHLGAPRDPRQQTRRSHTAPAAQAAGRLGAALRWQQACPGAVLRWSERSFMPWMPQFAVPGRPRATPTGVSSRLGSSRSRQVSSCSPGSPEPLSCLRSW